MVKDAGAQAQGGIGGNRGGLFAASKPRSVMSLPPENSLPRRHVPAVGW